MKLKTNPHDRAQAIASRWKLTALEHIVETPRAHIFKVDSPDGRAALKLYKEIGASGEGSALPFLRGLPPGVGPKIHRVSLLRTAVLMEWLEGPTLGALMKDGQETQVTELIGEVAQRVLQTDFRHKYLYQRTLPRLKSRIHSSAENPDLQVSADTRRRTVAILEHLEKTTPAEKIIHGDLIFDNVILTADGPRLIDPKGRRSDPPFELAKCFMQPVANVPLADFEQRSQDRLAILADAIDAPPQRLVQWATMMFAQMVIFGAVKKPNLRGLEPHLISLLTMSER